MENQEKKFLSQENLSTLLSNKVTIYSSLIGLLLIVLGLVYFKSGGFTPQTKIEVLEGTTEGLGENLIVVEIAGEVLTPGVYKLPKNSRVDDLIKISGGFLDSADENFISKNVNKASLLTDGQKIYIPNHSDLSSAKNINPIKTDQGVLGVNLEGNININTSSLAELDSLPGIGQKYGQSIIEHRPYSTIDELTTKDVLPKSVFEKIKDKIVAF